MRDVYNMLHFVRFFCRRYIHTFTLERCITTLQRTVCRWLTIRREYPVVYNTTCLIMLYIVLYTYMCITSNIRKSKA